MNCCFVNIALKNIENHWNILEYILECISTYINIYWHFLTIYIYIDTYWHTLTHIIAYWHSFHAQASELGPCILQAWWPRHHQKQFRASGEDQRFHYFAASQLANPNSPTHQDSPGIFGAFWCYSWLFGACVVQRKCWRTFSTKPVWQFLQSISIDAFHVASRSW